MVLEIFKQGYCICREQVPFDSKTKTWSSSQRLGKTRNWNKAEAQFIGHEPFGMSRICLTVSFDGFATVPRFKGTANECVARDDLAEILVSE